MDGSLLHALRDVVDPEIPISIVDLGLIIEAERRGSTARIALTFTAMGCPAMDMLMDDIRERLLREPAIERVDIDVVWHPIWNAARISEEGKAQLRELGIGV